MGEPITKATFSLPPSLALRTMRLSSAVHAPASEASPWLASVLVGISRLLDEADEALTQRRWDVVQERAQDILSIDPENSEGVAFLAAAERALGSSGAATEGPPLSPSPAAPGTSSSPVQPTSFAN